MKIGVKPFVFTPIWFVTILFRPELKLRFLHEVERGEGTPVARGYSSITVYVHVWVLRLGVTHLNLVGFELELKQGILLHFKPCQKTQCQWEPTGC